MDVRSFNVTPVSHFVEAEPLDTKFFFISKKISAYLNVFHRKKILKKFGGLTKNKIFYQLTFLEFYDDSEF